MIKIIPVVLCGGSGTRLWPMSRMDFPKQFLCLTSDESLIQQAARRLLNLASEDIDVGPPLIVTGEEHRFLATEQLREIGIENAKALLEPIGRNTAPALTLAALAASENYQDPVLVVTPSDQALTLTDEFTKVMQVAIRDAELGTIVVLGVKPDSPEIGYGYIKVNEVSPFRTEGISCDDLIEVKQFIEKPNAAKAAEYLLDGNYYWNAGIFVVKASVWLKALDKFRPDILLATQYAWQSRSTDEAFIRPGKSDFIAIPSESIDFAVMEHCPGSAFPIKMLPLHAGWSDLGAWDAVWKVLKKDERGNAHIGDVLTTGSYNTLVHANSRLVSLVGVNDVVVIETVDAVLVVDKTRSQDVKQIVTSLAKEMREEHILHRKVHRPWGWYDSIDEGSQFKVKRIMVKPKASLSLQKHQHRAEHWIVVKGTAEITIGSTVMTLSENQSTYIPIGEAHRLTNPGSSPLEIIEVQSGSYLGEDDIERIEDNYGRV
jgi:mannose-1-phosphate guanylyltransferase/mannose-6-phosphate isomerase